MSSERFGQRRIVLITLLGVADAAARTAADRDAAGRAAASVARVLAGDDVVLGVRHQAEHDARRVADPGDVGDRTVGVGARVAQRDLAGGGERRRVGVHVAAFAVGDRAVDRVVDVAGPDARDWPGAGRARPTGSRSARCALWPSAPGSRPVRVSTWNPLQMPITGWPAATNARERVAEPDASRSSANMRPAPSASA